MLKNTVKNTANVFTSGFSLIVYIVAVLTQILSLGFGLVLGSISIFVLGFVGWIIYIFMIEVLRML